MLLLNKNKPNYFFFLGILILLLLGLYLIHKKGVIKKFNQISKKNLIKNSYLPFEERLSKATISLSRIKDYLNELQSQNRDLKERIKELDRLLEAKEKENAELLQSYSKLKEELEKIKLEQNNLRDKLSQKDAEFLNLNLQKVTLEAKVDELNTKLSMLTHINSFLEDKLTQSEKNKLKLEEEMNKIKVDLTKKAEEELQKKTDEFNQLLNNKEKERLALVSELEQLRTQLNELNLAYESMKNNLTQLSEMFSKKELELIQKSQEISKLRQDYEQIAKERDVLLFTLQEKERTVLDLNTEVSRLQKKISDLQIELSSAIEQQKKTLEQLNEATSLNASLHERLLRMSQTETGLPLGSKKDEDRLKADELRKKVEVMLDIKDKQ